MLNNWMQAYARTIERPPLPKLMLALVVILSTNPAFGFLNDKHGHPSITHDALSSLTINLSGKKLGFSPNALQEIKSSVVGVDSPIWGEFSDSKAHCDDETLEECFQRVANLKLQILNLLKGTRPAGERARTILGQALHTIQDFYAHSNWVHNPGPNKKEIHRGFGKKWGDDSVGEWPKKKLGATCVEAGLFEGNHILTGEGLTEITTGYFRKSGIPANKCNHGGPIYGGINKDSEDKKQLFYDARKLAVDATRVFVEQIVQEITSNEIAVRAFLTATGDR